MRCNGFRRACVSAVVGAVVLSAVAPTARADGPATTRAAAPDLSTARSATLAFLDASWAGDVDAARQVLVDDERQRAFIAGSFRFQRALRTLEAAAAKRFGEQGRAVSGYPSHTPAEVAPRLTVNEDGDRATVSFADALLPLGLRRVDGRWRVDLTDAIAEAQVTKAADASVPAAEAAEAVAAEIEAGRFGTLGEAAAAFHERRRPRRK